jgi:hypothetical protein
MLTSGDQYRAGSSIEVEKQRGSLFLQSLLGFPLLAFAFLFNIVLGTCRSFFLAPLKLKQVEENADKKC